MQPQEWAPNQRVDALRARLIRCALELSNRATPAEIVREFCSVWERGEFGRFGEFLTEDAVFHMLPLEPVRGPEAIRKECRKLDLLGTVSVKILHLAAAGNVVFTERLDGLRTPERARELPVAGVFELRDGKIAAWRDYFDLRQALDTFGLDAPV